MTSVRDRASRATKSDTKAATSHSNSTPDPAILFLHTQLPSYAATPLHDLPDLAREWGVGHVYLKDESTRFGLPSFKILGASWAVYRALSEIVGGDDGDGDAASRSSGPSLEGLKQRIRTREQRGEARIGLVTASAGNWGRAVARMGRLLGVRVLVLVPGSTGDETVDAIASEGEGSDEVEVRRLDRDYDGCLDLARRKGDEAEWTLVMDASWEGYERIPQVRQPTYPDNPRTQTS